MRHSHSHVHSKNFACTHTWSRTFTRAHTRNNTRTRRHTHSTHAQHSHPQMCNAGEHSHTRHSTCENGQPSRHTPALPHFSNLPSKTAHVFPSRRNWCAGLHRHTSPWLSRHALADHALAPCHTQGVEKCESPRLGSATRAALAHAVPSRTTPVRLFASPHLGLPLPRPCTCTMPHQGVEKCESPRTGSATR